MANYPDKRNLAETAMYIHRFTGQGEMEATLCSWLIGNYKSLKKNVVYWNKEEKELNWTLKISRKNKCYAVTIVTENFDNVIWCYVLYDNKKFSRHIRADKVSENEHAVNVPDSIIFVAENWFVGRNKIKLLFSFKTMELVKPFHQTKEFPVATIGLMKEYIRQINPSENRSTADFIIRSTGWSIRVHKAILSARSKYFRQYIEENCKEGEIGEMVIDTTNDAMLGVIAFLYTGQMIFDSKRTLIRNLELCSSLGITKPILLAMDLQLDELEEN